METGELRNFKESLTGFHTREVLLDYLNNQLTAAKSQSIIFALLILDIDFFKSINDKYGHLCGDDALKFFAGIINEALQGEFFVARYGGDEFVIVMTGCAQNEALELAKRIKGLLSKKFFIYKERSLSLRASIGIAVFPGDGDKTEKLIKRADDALYYAKNHGRNKIILASKVRSFYPKMKYLNFLIIVIAIAVTVLLFVKIKPLRFIDFQAVYSKIIIKANFASHKSKYKYNYCSLELDDQSKIEGWVVREDKERVFISKEHPNINANIVEIPKKRIKVYIKLSK